MINNKFRNHIFTNLRLLLNFFKNSYFSNFCEMISSICFPLSPSLIKVYKKNSFVKKKFFVKGYYGDIIAYN